MAVIVPCPTPREPVVQLPCLLAGLSTTGRRTCVRGTGGGSCVELLGAGQLTWCDAASGRTW